jgi:hypothetical protein
MRASVYAHTRTYAYLHTPMTVHRRLGLLSDMGGLEACVHYTVPILHLDVRGMCAWVGVLAGCVGWLGVLLGFAGWVGGWIGWVYCGGWVVGARIQMFVKCMLGGWVGWVGVLGWVGGLGGWVVGARIQACSYRTHNVRCSHPARMHARVHPPSGCASMTQDARP